MVIQEALRPTFSPEELQHLSRVKTRWSTRGMQEKIPSGEHSLSWYIDHFDKHWQEEGLPKDWYNLKKKVGFSMDTQMHLLKDTDSSSVSLWAEQTKRDALGFCLEYLSGKLVYPFLYEQDLISGEYVDPKYKKSILSGVSERERGGQVKRSLASIQEFFLSPYTPDGSIAIMTSPKGETGLTTDDGEAIHYPDSYFLVFVKDGNTMKGCTIKTDFSLAESREVIQKLTGKTLTENASVEEYVASVAFLRPWDNPWEKGNISVVGDVLPMLKNVRSPSKKEFAFEDKTWREVEKDIERGEQLYNFNQTTQDILDEFTQYVTTNPNVSVLDLRKAVAATLLRLSKLFLTDKSSLPVDIGSSTYALRASSASDGERDVNKQYVTFGTILNKVATIPGCAGGGSEKGRRTWMNSLTPRDGTLDKTLCCTCPFCGEQVEATISGGRISCPECNNSAPYTGE